MSKTEQEGDAGHAVRELREAELDHVSGGAPADGCSSPSLSREPTKHPAKVTVPDLK